MENYFKLIIMFIFLTIYFEQMFASEQRPPIHPETKFLKKEEKEEDDTLEKAAKDEGFSMIVQRGGWCSAAIDKTGKAEDGYDSDETVSVQKSSPEKRFSCAKDDRCLEVRIVVEKPVEPGKGAFVLEDYEA